MSVIAFFSAKGSPGVTTTAMLFASLWPRPVLLVDADPAGGDVALRLPDPHGRPLDRERGLMTLLPLARRELDPPVLRQHAQAVLGGTEIIAGLPGPEQASAAGPLWPTLAHAFAGLNDADVIFDLGRMDSHSPVLPLLRVADVGICLLSPSLSSVVSTRSRLRALVPEAGGLNGARGPLIGALVQGGSSTRDAESAIAALQAEDRLLLSFGQIAHDPGAAQMFDGRPVSRPERSLLVRSGRQAVSRVFAAAHESVAAAPTSAPPLLTPTAAPFSVTSSWQPDPTVFMPPPNPVPHNASASSGFHAAPPTAPPAASPTSSPGMPAAKRGGRRRAEGRRRAQGGPS